MRLRYWACGLGIAYAAMVVALLASPFERLPAVHLLDDTVIATVAVVTAALLRELGRQTDDARLRGLGACVAATALLEGVHLLVGIEWFGPLAWVSRSETALHPATWKPAAYLLPLSILFLPVVDGSRRRDLVHRFGVVGIGAGIVALFLQLPPYGAGPLGIHRPDLVPVPALWVLAAWVNGRRWRWDMFARVMGVTAAFAIVGHLTMLWSASSDDLAAIAAHNGKLLSYAFLLVATMRRAASDARRRVDAQRAVEQVNQALGRSEERLQLALRAMNDAVWDWDVAGQRFTVSDLYRAWFGPPPATGDADAWFAERIHPEDRERVRASLAEALGAGRDVWSCDYRFRRVDGSWARIHDRAYLAKNTSGRVTRVVGAMQDVTERLEAEDALRRSELRFRSLFHSTFSFIGLLATDGNVLEVNQAALEFSGRAPEDLVGKPLWETGGFASSSEAHVRLRDGVARAARGEIVRHQLETVGREGDVIFVDVALKPVLDADRRVTQIIAEARDVTEQVRAAEAQRASEEQFRLAMQHSAIGVALVAPEGRFLVINSALAHLTGYDETELLALTFQDITYPPDLDADLEQVRRMLAREIETYQMEKRYIRKDGRIIWILLNVSLVWSPTGEPRYFIAQVQDTTARRTAEEDLRALTADLERRVEERTADLARATTFLDSIVENLPAMVFVKDAESLRFVRINRAGERLLGYPRTALLDKSDYDFLPEPQADCFTAKDREVLAGNVVVDVPEEPITTRDQGVRLLHTRKIPIKDADGTPRYLLGISEDITDHRRTEERLRLLVEAAPSGIFIADAAGAILLANEPLARQFGYPDAALVGRAIDGLLPELVWHDLVARLPALAREGAGLRRGRRSDGSEFPVDVVLSSLQVGDVWHVFGYVTDISDRVRAEDEVRSANAHLAQHAQQLEVAMRELEAFSYTVSHDLRAPLRHIGSYARLLQTECQDRLGDEGRRYLQTITDAVKRTGRLIDDLLSFSRMGRSEMRRGTVELDAVVGESIRAAEADARGRRIDWVRHPLPVVEGDTAMLRLAIGNLVENAVKYTRPREHPWIEIGALSETEDAVVLYVRDNGVGFDMRHAGKLFGVFQRLHHPDEFEGTGIGLANVRRIVERHGGRVWAEARVDEGATFFVMLPKRASIAPPAAQPDRGGDGRPEG